MNVEIAPVWAREQWGFSLQLHHASIPFPVGMLDEGRQFYREVLGLEEIPKPSSLASEPGVWFSFGNQELHLFAEEDANATRRQQHLCISVDNLEDVRARIEEHDYEIKEAVEVPNRPRFFCYDPSGNRIEFTEIRGPYR